MSETNPEVEALGQMMVEQVTLRAQLIMANRRADRAEAELAALIAAPSAKIEPPHADT